MKLYPSILSLLLVILFFLSVLNVNAAENYKYVDPSDLSFEVTFKDDLYNGTVVEFMNPVTKNSGLYVKIVNTIITSLKCNGQSIEIKNNNMHKSVNDLGEFPHTLPFLRRPTRTGSICSCGYPARRQRVGLLIARTGPLRDCLDHAARAARCLSHHDSRAA